MARNASPPPEVHRGLIGVYFDRSSICSIDGAAGDLRYRGYSIHDLAESASFEETAYLLLHGDLPSRSELVAFDAALKDARVLPSPVVDLIGSVAAGHPMDVLRTAVSALAVFDPEVRDTSPAATRRKAIRAISQVPMIVAAHHRLRSGQALVAPDPKLGQAANFLYMLDAKTPSARVASLIETDLVLHAEHGPNASSFAARVVIGTDADLHGALTAAIAALAGPAHGGAAENVMKMVREVGSPDRAAEYVQARRAAREPVMGFGHRVYRTEDPRARHLREGVRALSTEVGQPYWFETLEAVVAAMAPYARHGVHVNVDFYAGVIYHLCGIPEDLFVPLFAIGRSPGWAAHALEQLESNILIRPLTLYAGPGERPYVPIEQRPDRPSASPARSWREGGRRCPGWCCRRAPSRASSRRPAGSLTTASRAWCSLAMKRPSPRRQPTPASAWMISASSIRPAAIGSACMSPATWSGGPGARPLPGV